MPRRPPRPPSFLRPGAIGAPRRALPAALLAALLAALAPCLPARAQDAEAAAAAIADDDAAEAAAERRAARWRVTVEAPGALRELLLRYLDVARYAEQAEAADGAERPLRITQGELARLVAATPAQARALLETEGHFGAQVTARLEDGGAEPARVRVRVDPGPLASVGAVRIEFAGVLSVAADTAGGPAQAAAQALARRLRESFALRPGQPFTQAAWRDAKNALLAELRAQGYALAGFAGTSAEVDAAAHRARLYLVADSGPLLHVEAVRIEGLRHVDAAAVRSLLTIGPGDVLREQPLQDLQDRLIKTNLFDTVSVTPDVPAPEGELPDTSLAALGVPVVVRLNERALQQATVGVGVSDTTGPRITLEHVHQRPFGLAWQAKTQLQVGRDERSASIDLLSHPHPGPHRDLVSGALARAEAAGLIVLSQTARVGRTQDLERVERLYFLQFERDITRAEATGLVTDDTSALSLNHHWVWRRLDNPILPTAGHGLALELGAGRSFHTEQDSGFFGRAVARYTGFWPLGDSWFTQGRLQLGQVFAQQDTSVPYTQLFRTGGDDSVRGYGNQALGPTDATGHAAGGRVVAVASAELARPFSARTPQFWWATFVDAGNAARNWRDLEPALGYGVGLRWRSPVGPLKIDLAYGSQARRARLHFTIGITF